MTARHEAYRGPHGCRWPALHHRRTKHEWQRDLRQRHQEQPSDLFFSRAPHAAQILLAVAPPYDAAQRRAKHDSRHDTPFEQGGYGYPRDRTDRDQDDGWRDGLG